MATIDDDIASPTLYEKRHGVTRLHSQSFKPYTLPATEPTHSVSLSIPPSLDETHPSVASPPINSTNVNGTHHGKRYVPSPQELEKIVTPFIDAFPREQHGSFLCIFHMCEAPLLRSDEIFVLCKHLRTHIAAGDVLLRNALDQHSGACNTSALIKLLEGQIPNVMLPTPDTSESSLQISSTSVAKSVEDSEDNEADDGAGLAMDGEDVEENEDEELIILTQPKMRQSTLRKQMLYYGLPLFRMDSKQRYVCFFKGCKQRMANNFSRHILRHEKLNHPLDPKLEHLCARRGTPGYQPGSGSILVPLHQTTPISLPERVTKSEDCTPSPSPSPPPKSNSLSPQQQQSCAQLDSLEALTEAALLRINQRGM